MAWVRCSFYRLKAVRMEDVAAIVQDFRWLPHRLDLSGRAIHFLVADRDTHRAVTFLDDEVSKRASAHKQVGLAQVNQFLAAAPAGESHYLFHSAFCCSTLLTRALDCPGKAIGLKEPAILNDLAQAVLAGHPGTSIRSPLETVLQLLSRPFGAGEKVVVKPSNVANPLIDQIMEARLSAKALFLSSALPDFLRSVAKKGLWGRIWARRLVVSLERVTELETGFSDAERWELSDMQVAALAWLHQRAQFARLLSQLPAERAMSLDSATLLDNPSGTMAAVSEFLGLGLSADEVGEIAAGPVFARDSKRPEREYDAGQRRSEHHAIEGVVGEEIAMVVRWAGSVADALGVPNDLPRPLLG